nr:VIP36-like protein [Cherax quadricarinatus]
MQEGDVFGSKDFFTGLAVIMDTYSNHNGPHNHGHPYISAMINNGTLHYDHDRDGTHTQLSSGCVAKFRNLEHDTYISVKYVHDTLTVSTDIDNKQVFKECFSVDGVKLPLGYYFGVSAATGDLSDAHDIISLKTYDLTTPDDVSTTSTRAFNFLFSFHKHNSISYSANYSVMYMFNSVLKKICKVLYIM